MGGSRIGRQMGTTARLQTVVRCAHIELVASGQPQGQNQLVEKDKNGDALGPPGVAPAAIKKQRASGRAVYAMLCYDMAGHAGYATICYNNQAAAAVAERPVRTQRAVGIAVGATAATAAAAHGRKASGRQLAVKRARDGWYSDNMSEAWAGAGTVWNTAVGS